MQTPEELAFDYNIKQGFMLEDTQCYALAELIRARDAEIRRECAEMAARWLKTLHHEPEPGLPWSEKIKRMQELQIKTLIAAIIGEEE